MIPRTTSSHASCSCCYCLCSSYAQYLLWYLSSSETLWVFKYLFCLLRTPFLTVNFDFFSTVSLSLPLSFFASLFSRSFRGKLEQLGLLSLLILFVYFHWAWLSENKNWFIIFTFLWFFSGCTFIITHSLLCHSWRDVFLRSLRSMCIFF